MDSCLLFRYKICPLPSDKFLLYFTCSPRREHITIQAAPLFVVLYNLQTIPIRQFRILIIQIIGIPECNRGNIILKRKISSSSAPSQSLDCHSEILFKIDRVSNMPTIHIESAICNVCLICGIHFRKTGIRYTVFYILIIYLKIIGSTKIIFCSGTTNGRVVCIAIDEELDFCFSPPAIVVYTPIQIGSNIPSISCDIVQNCIIRFIRKRIYPAELCVEV